MPAYKEFIKNKLFVQEYTIHQFTHIYDEELPACNKQYESQCLLNSSNGVGAEWYGGLTSLDAATRLLDLGWSEGAKRAMELKNNLESELPNMRSRKRRQVWADEGDTLCVDRALQGNWDFAYRTTRREHIVSPCITFNVGFGGNCFLTAEQLFWSGATMIALSDICESAGYSTRINACCKSSYYGNKYSLMNIIVKNFGEPLRPDAMASVVSAAGIFRSYGFRGICAAPFDVGSGLGRCIEWDEITPVLKEVGYSLEENTINVKDCYTKEAAIAEITRITKSFDMKDVNKANEE